MIYFEKHIYISMKDMYGMKRKYFTDDIFEKHIDLFLYRKCVIGKGVVGKGSICVNIPGNLLHGIICFLRV